MCQDRMISHKNLTNGIFMHSAVGMYMTIVNLNNGYGIVLGERY